MQVVFRAVYVCAALLSISAGVLVVASLFIADRAPQGTAILGIHLTVGIVFLGLGALLFGLQGQVARLAAIVRAQDGETGRELAKPLKGLVAYLLAGGALLGAVLAVMTYAILTRIDQGFAVFG
ncbi:hypothetical protein G3480_13555 [Thiorhodococcus mannitoliphagus]|uniref:Uncharacterized protein n=1 Tax=Thiorhodococcus mannitoliphagus TaxID=329406 RepID=A0A6P1E0P2_9GAMM|nr:hypothetical protein [Thiorhodococcus mannitoliphagus]NEX21325.1 hypothetical protein [Thiorhodococcus mannitoliphagus]